VWEPFNQHWGLTSAPPPYEYLRRGENHRALDDLERYLQTGRGRWRVKRGPRGGRLPALNAQWRAMHRWREWHRNGQATPVVKDPFLLLSLGAVQPRMTRRPVVVTVRHPCSWVMSLRRVGWPAGPELNRMLAQDDLVDAHLRDLLPRRDWTKVDDVEAGATAWACLYHLVAAQRAAGVEAVVVPLEAFGARPVPTMTEVFRRTALSLPADLPALAERYTGTGNAVVPNQAGTVHLLRRDSRALSQAWRAALPATDVARVRQITEQVYSGIYPSWDDPEA
jgi:hypothetical protein